MNEKILKIGIFFCFAIIVFGLSGLAYMSFDSQKIGTSKIETKQQILTNADNEAVEEVQESTLKSEIAIKLQNILDSTEGKEDLPENTAILIEFFDNEQKVLLQGTEFFDYNGEEYDLVLKTESHHLDNFEEFCTTMNEIKENQEYNYQLVKNKPILLWKYRNLISLKNMC